MAIKVKGYQASSLIEWSGKIVSIIFTAGCNFKCPFCHNRNLVIGFENTPDLDFDELLGKIKARRKWIDAVEFTGGEPLLHPEIEAMLKKVKAEGLLTKVDTNGSFPSKLRNLIDKKLVDYVAMDIKAPLAKYEEVVNAKVEINKIQESIKLLMESGIDYEFRTTVLPKLHSKQDIKEIGKLIKGSKRYWLQNFVPKNTLDKSYDQESPFTNEKMSELKKIAETYVDTVDIR